jgi:hypothetical protein
MYPWKSMAESITTAIDRSPPAANPLVDLSPGFPQKSPDEASNGRSTAQIYNPGGPVWNIWAIQCSTTEWIPIYII